MADVPLPGGKSRFDYESLDPQSHRLYIAHLGANLVTVFDTQAGKVVGNVTGIKEVHGVLAVPETGKVYATATGDNQVAVIDPQSLSVIAKVPAADYPDGLAFDPDNGKLYVSDESGGTDTVIDTSTNKSVATIPLGGEAGNTQFDPVSHLIYVAVQSKGQIVGIDPSTDQVVSRDDVQGCDYPHGLYINPARRTAFIGCERNNKLVVMDMLSMKVTSDFSVGQTPDVLAFDPSLGRLYVAAEEGDFTAFAQDDAGVRQIAKASVGANAHSVAVNPDTHHLYLPLEDSGGQPALREVALESQ